MKKILIITYYWPPKGGVGVQRWLKLTKYLSKENYHPVIYTPDGGVSPLVDESLIDSIPSGLEILKRKIFEPQRILSFFTKKRPSSDILVQNFRPGVIDRLGFGWNDLHKRNQKLIYCSIS